jgi:hypothetical protein
MSSSSKPEGGVGRVEVLTTLQDYAKVQEDGNLALKACVWQLTKSRRNRNQGILSVSMGSAFSADLLREDLRARTLVVQDVPNSDPSMGDLVDDDDNDNDDSKKPQTSSPPTAWKLVDAVEERARKKENTTTTTSNTNTNTKGVGLRQRKGNDEDNDDDDDDETAKEWTMVEEEQVSQEEELLRLDPLEFFGGLRPRELKLAQEQAKLALESYIQAANQAAKILALLNTQ